MGATKVNVTPLSRMSRAVAVLAVLVAGTAGCGLTGGPTHELTFQVTGSAPADEVVIDPPGEQAGNAETLRDVTLPWQQTTSTGFGFARLAATGQQPLSCRILMDGQEIAAEEGTDGGSVECRASVQDG